MKSPCARGREEVLFGWASDSDEHRLPGGVAYSVGPGTGILEVVLQVIHVPVDQPHPPSPLCCDRILVLTDAATCQVRYAAGRPAEDRSGFSLTVAAQTAPLAAGMVTFASLFTLPAKQPAYKVRHPQQHPLMMLQRRTVSIATVSIATAQSPLMPTVLLTLPAQRAMAK